MRSSAVSGLTCYHVACWCCLHEGFHMGCHILAYCTSNVHHSYHPSADAQSMIQDENFPFGCNHCHRSCCTSCRCRGFRSVDCCCHCCTCEVNQGGLNCTFLDPWSSCPSGHPSPAATAAIHHCCNSQHRDLRPCVQQM